MGSFSNLVGLSRQASDVQEQRLTARFHRYWDELRGDQDFPAPGSLKAEDIAEFMPHAFTIDLAADRKSSKVRYVGKELVADCGTDLVERSLWQVPARTLIYQAIAVFDEVVEKMQPAFVSDSYYNAEGFEVLFRAVLIPFSRTGSSIDYVVGVVNGKVTEHQRPEVPAELIRLTELPPPIETTVETLPDTLEVEEDAVIELEAIEADIVEVPPAPAPDATPAVAEAVVVEVSDADIDLAAPEPVASEDIEAEAKVDAGPALPVLSGTPRGRLVVICGAKSGCGATTTAMHMIAAWLAAGRKVASVDLDTARHGLSDDIANRKAASRPSPTHVQMISAGNGASWLQATMTSLLRSHDRVVVDVADADPNVRRTAFAAADTVVTVLGQADSASDNGTRMLSDAEAVAAAQAAREADGHAAFDWVVLQNRLPPRGGPAPAALDGVLAEILSAAGRYRCETGLGDRALYADLRARGLTLCDPQDAGTLSLAHIAARQEFRSLATRLRL